MKKIVIIIIALIIALPALTKAEEIETIFGNEPLKSGGYGCPEIKVTKIMNSTGLLVGGRGGWIMNSTFSIGGGGYGLTTTHQVPVNNESYYLRFGYGGVILEYINSSNKSVHFTVNALIGGGNAANTLRVTGMSNHDKDEIHDESNFFVFEPAITMDVNMFSFMRVGVGASWRFISGLDLAGVTNSQVSGPAASLCLKFGKF